MNVKQEPDLKTLLENREMASEIFDCRGCDLAGNYGKDCPVINNEKKMKRINEVHCQINSILFQASLRLKEYTNSIFTKNEYNQSSRLDNLEIAKKPLRIEIKIFCPYWKPVPIDLGD